MNALSKVCAVVVIAAPLVLGTAYLYCLVTGTSLRAAMFKTYSILQDTPGACVWGVRPRPLRLL